MKRIILGVILFTLSFICSAREDKESLKGFIVSDAHVGWENEQQPSVEKQKEMIDQIRRKFPDLDVFIDTGDAHHNGKDRDKERGEWTDMILGQDWPIPFFYVPGNHEIAHANDRDSEFTCAVLGSHEARPYYSFDIQGIHFVSVPELIRAVYVPKELLEWLRLDLELNKDKTTILLSHNSLIGYSKNFEPGYRGVVNTKEIIDIMNEYPNCIAWMYGHNHNYEVVEKDGRLFVSNGRIGGFDPSKGKHGLGGIYFEISEDEVDIRCYSAEYDTFVDMIDNSEQFRGILKKETSFNPEAAAAYSIGCGMSRNGEKSPVYHHHISDNGKMDLYAAPVKGNVINEDPGFEYFMSRNADKPKKDNQLMGCSISDNKTSYQWKNPGVLIFASEKNRTVTFPRSSHNKYTYYRVAADKEYEMEITLKGENSGKQKMTVSPKLHDRYGNLAALSDETSFILDGTKQTIRIPFRFDETKIKESIYSDPSSDNVFNLSAEVEFSNLHSDVMLYRCEIRFKNAGKESGNMKIGIDDTIYDFGKATSCNSHMEVDMRVANRSVMSTFADGNGMLTWLLKLDNLEWQVLGAPCANKEKSIEIGPFRNTYSHRKEVSINKFNDRPGSIYVCKLRNINNAEIFPLEKGNKNIIVKVSDCLEGTAEIVVYSSGKRLAIAGAEKTVKDGDLYVLTVREGSEVKIREK